MNEEERLKHLSLIIQRLVNKYVEGRAEAKTGKKVKDFQKETIERQGTPHLPERVPRGPAARLLRRFPGDAIPA